MSEGNLTWRRSTQSLGNGACVEVASWRKSSYSDEVSAGNCVEVAALTTAVIGIRDSKDPGGPVIEVDVAAMRRFMTSIRG